jgi:hypothetical protein
MEELTEEELGLIEKHHEFFSSSLLWRTVSEYACAGAFCRGA